MILPGFHPQNDEPEKDSLLVKLVVKTAETAAFGVGIAAAKLAPDDPWGSDDETQEEYNQTHGWY